MNDITLIKNQVSLKATIESYGVKLQGTSPQYKGLCPFHNDTNKSLSVNDDIGKWQCFGCRKYGDVFDFIQNYENCSFSQAVLTGKKRQTCVRKSRVKQNKIQQKAISASEQSKVAIILEKCWEYFQSKLTPEITAKYLTSKIPFHITVFENNKYLTKLYTPYGFTLETIKAFRIGFAPSSVKELVNTLLLEGFTKDEIALSGLFIQDKKGNLRAYYKNRIVFPYLDEAGNILYSIGRRTEFTPLNQYEPKYKKQLTYKSKPYVSRAIDNSHFFMEHIAKSNDHFVITEGITDCIAANMNGIPSLSPVTVRFRTSDLSRLQKLCEGKVVYICNDNETNKSGEKGAIQTVEYLRSHGIKASSVTLPRPRDKDKIDLCEWLLTHDHTDFKKLLY